MHSIHVVSLCVFGRTLFFFQWFAESKSQEQQSCRVVVVITSSPLPPRLQSVQFPFLPPRPRLCCSCKSPILQPLEARPFSSPSPACLPARPLAQQRSTSAREGGRGSHPACLQIQCLSPMGNCASAVDAFVQRGGRSSATPGESNHQQARAISLLFLLKASIFGLLAFLIGMQQVILFNCLVNSVIL